MKAAIWTVITERPADVFDSHLTFVEVRMLNRTNGLPVVYFGIKDRKSVRVVLVVRGWRGERFVMVQRSSLPGSPTVLGPPMNASAPAPCSRQNGRCAGWPSKLDKADNNLGFPSNWDRS
jgi:hypothetical protein